MKALYTKILTLNNDGEALSKSFRDLISEWAEENEIEQYNPIELSHLLKEELECMLGSIYSDAAEALQTNSTTREAWVMDELADAVKLVLDDNDSKSGMHWPDVIAQCKYAYDKKLKLDNHDY
jgi:hypothetical protein